MHRQGIRIDFEDMDSEDVYDVFLVFLSEYLYNKYKEIDRISRLFWRINQ